MGWDVNVHVKLQKQLMLRTRGVGTRTMFLGEVLQHRVHVHTDADDDDDDDDDDNSPNETCHFRDEISSRN